MASIPGTSRIAIEFHLTPEQQLHVFAHWKEQNPSIPLEEINKRSFQQAVRDLLGAHGWKIVNTTLPEHVELKKMDYKAVLKGIVA
jgi:hypothetical protein